MRNKRRKLVVQQDANLRHAKEGETSNTLEGIRIYVGGDLDCLRACITPASLLMACLTPRPDQRRDRPSTACPVQAHRPSRRPLRPLPRRDKDKSNAHYRVQSDAEQACPVQRVQGRHIRLGHGQHHLAKSTELAQLPRRPERLASRASRDGSRCIADCAAQAQLWGCGFDQGKRPRGEQSCECQARSASWRQGRHRQGLPAAFPSATRHRCKASTGKAVPSCRNPLQRSQVPFTWTQSPGRAHRLNEQEPCATSASRTTARPCRQTESEQNCIASPAPTADE
jgi:hypothetical protein